MKISCRLGQVKNEGIPQGQGLSESLWHFWNNWVQSSMILLALSLSAGLSVLGLIWAVFGFIAAVIPAVVVTLLVYFFAARKIGSASQIAMMAAVSEIQKGRVDRGIALLLDIKKRYAYWQFFTASSIDGQIGSIYYMRQEFSKAKPYLEKSFVRHWNARAMLAVLSFKKKEYKKMDRVFETASRYSPKQGLLWSLWAYCHWKAGNLNKAIEILSSGQKKLGDLDKNLIANLQNVKNNKKMKMTGYGQEWLQFHLEPAPQVRYVRH